MFRQLFNSFFNRNQTGGDNTADFNDIFNVNTPAAPPAMKAPPASQRAINALPMVKVTADDVLEATNKECLICLEEHHIGSWACKLQCGHLYHRQCLVEWLEKHCTCPVCRFEIETDDSRYEQGRRKRMENRKFRLRKDELQKKSVQQLRDLARHLDVSIAGCIDKREIIEVLISSGRIEVVEGAPPVEIFNSEFYKLSVSQLRYMLLSFGISDRDALEKADLRSRLLESGRIVVIDDPVNEMTAAAVDAAGTHAKESTSYSFSLPSATTETFKLSELRNMSVSDLRRMCSKHAISIENCLDKRDVVDRVLESNKVSVNNDIQEEASNDYNYKLPTDDDPVKASTEFQTKADAEAMVIVEDVSDYEPFESPRQRRRMASGETSSWSATEYSFADADKVFCPKECHVTDDGGITKDDNASIYGTGGAAELHSKPSGHLMDDVHAKTDSDFIFVDSAGDQFESNGKEADDATPGNCSGGSSSATSAHDSSFSAKDDRFIISEMLMAEMSIGEIKSIMDAYEVAHEGCLEKTDMISRLRDCPHILVIE